MDQKRHAWIKGFLAGALVAAIVLVIRLVGAFTGPTTAPGVGSGAIAVDGSNRVGIGTSTPQARLSVGDTTSSLVAIFGGGSGKIDAGTIDPVYTIGGRRYATYLPSMIGVKEETGGVIRPACDAQQRVCEYTIDFKALEEGSDLWLFSKVTDLKNHFNDLTVLLTPSSPAEVWYEKNEKDLRLTISAKPSRATSLEVSYRLTAPRFDSATWPTRLEDGGSSGFILDDGT